MKVKIYNLKTQEENSVSLPEEIFAVKGNKDLLAQAVRVYLANQRKAQAKAKTRAEVSGSGRKIWRQKGTGRARHGDQYAPIFVGGGVAHGPNGERNWQLTLPKRLKKVALKMALSEKFKKGEIIIIDQFSSAGEKTKNASSLLWEVLKEATKVEKNVKKPKPKVVLVIGEKSDLAARPFRNLNWVKVVKAGSFNSYLALNNRFLVFEKESLLEIEARLKEIRND